MKISIIGCGRWGTFLAWYFNGIGYSVLLYGRTESERYKSLNSVRSNEFLTLPNEVILTDSLSKAIDFSDVVIIAINEQNLRVLMEDVVNYNYNNKTLVLCMKGIENKTCKRLSEVVYDVVGDLVKIAIMIGPGQPSDIVKGMPACLLIDSLDRTVSELLAERFSSKLISVKVGNDLIGNEIGAATNKLVGIAGGILDELGYTSLKGPLMVAGTREISRLIECLGGNANSAYGICCLGDYQASLFSEHSNSIAYGRCLVKKESFKYHTPGAFTAKTVTELANRFNMNIPILLQISKIIEGDEPRRLINILLKDWW